jgi:predicted ATP-grasp superfamily ATP-dependent carboligase
MKFYYIGLERYKILGKMLADYLKMDMHHILDNWDDIYKIKSEDLVYCHYFQPLILEGRCNIIGPKLTIAKKWDSKIFQYKNLYKVVPIPKYSIYNDYMSLVRILNMTDAAFITLPYGNTGDASVIYKKGDKPSDVAKKLGLEADKPFEVRVSEFIDKDFAVSNHIVIKDPKCIFVSPPVRQRIGKDGVTFEGGEYPANLKNGQLSKVYHYAREIGQVMGKDGYVGLAGIDFMFKGNDIYLCEVNPRKMGTTIGISAVMEYELGITLPVLEYLAFMKIPFPILEQEGIYSMGWSIDMTRHAPGYKNKPGDEKRLFNKPGRVKYYDGEFYFDIKSWRLA